MLSVPSLSNRFRQASDAYFSFRPNPELEQIVRERTMPLTYENRANHDLIDMINPLIRLVDASTSPDWTIQERTAVTRLWNLSVESRFRYNPESEDVANFGQVDETLYRGSQPTKDGYDWLITEIDIGCIISFRAEAEERPADLQQWPHVDYYNFNVVDRGTPTRSGIDKALITIDEQKKLNRKVFVNCRGGIGRTGIAAACWEIKNGVAVNKAIENAKGYGVIETILPNQEEFIRNVFAATQS